MAVAQLMKCAAVLIENPMVGMNQVEERIAAEEAVSSRTALLGIETRQPAGSIGIVVNCESVGARNSGLEDQDLDPELRLLASSGCDDRCFMEARYSVRRYPEIQPKTLRIWPETLLSGSGSFELYGLATGIRASGMKEPLLRSL
jgi:hypothetical protein